jgi:hypothetical protein
VLIENDGLQRSSSDSAGLEGPDPLQNSIELWYVASC